MALGNAHLVGRERLQTAVSGRSEAGCTLRFMLTEEQVELLAWIIQSGSGEVILVPVGNAPEDVAIIPNGPRQTINPADLRELVAEGLVRHVREQMHEVTNAGRQAYKELRPPPTDV